MRVKTNQWAVFESHVHLCKPQYIKSTGVDELSVSRINFWYRSLLFFHKENIEAR
mgnify:FL=1